MKDDDFDLARDLMMEDEAAMTGSIGRWLPTVVVLTALTGFIGLAWYAYHSGTQSMKDDDLLVVEADKTPMKEKPIDPGGMKFPNQDKTVFETFANNAQIPPKVEKLLPAPEEPLPKGGTSDTQTFVNEKLLEADGKEENTNKPEQVIGDQKPAVVATLDHAVKPAAAAPVKQEKKPAEPTAPKEEETEDAAPVLSYSKPSERKPLDRSAEAASDTGAKIQLGAYRSEKEAKLGWQKMQKQYASLSGKSPIIVKADLGKKGIYYRLRTGGFASSDDAKAFCAGLSAKGQSCMIAKD